MSSIESCSASRIRARVSWWSSSKRIDDPTDRLLATSTQIGNLAGAFLTGTTATTTGTLLQFRFAKQGRYLAVCMNRNHYLANWMFGFISVVGGDDDH